MKIGICGPFNPKYLEKYFLCQKVIKDLPNINITATSVNTYIESLLKAGYEIVVFTVDKKANKTIEINGNMIKIYIIPFRFKIRGFARYRVHKRIMECIEKEIDNLDILHAQWTYEYALATLPFSKNKPVFCSVRDWCPYLLSISKGAIEKYYWTMSYYNWNPHTKSLYNRITISFIVR